MNAADQIRHDVTTGLRWIGRSLWGAPARLWRWFDRTPSRTFFLNGAYVLALIGLLTQDHWFFGAALGWAAISVVQAIHDIANAKPGPVTLTGITVHADGKPVSISDMSVLMSGGNGIGVKVEGKPKSAFGNYPPRQAS